MASLDVLDYQVGLDAALAAKGEDGRPLLEPGLRRQAVREARRVLDAMAFRFALLDERPLPEDLDYLRALEAMKPPERAARVLARRRPLYRRNRVRRLATTFVSLGVVALVVAGLVYGATSEKATELALLTERTGADVTVTFNRTFEVSENVTRLHVDATVIPPPRGSPGVVEVRLLDPSGQVRVYESYAAGGNNYLRENVLDPQPGEWLLLVDFLEAKASVRVSVLGVEPTR